MYRLLDPGMETDSLSYVGLIISHGIYQLVLKNLLTVGSSTNWGFHLPTNTELCLAYIREKVDSSLLIHWR